MQIRQLGKHQGRRALALLIWRPKEKIKPIQAFTQKSRGRDVQEGKVILLTYGGVEEKETKRTDALKPICFAQGEV